MRIIVSSAVLEIIAALVFSGVLINASPKATAAAVVYLLALVFLVILFFPLSSVRPAIVPVNPARAGPVSSRFAEKVAKMGLSAGIVEDNHPPAIKPGQHKKDPTQDGTAAVAAASSCVEP